VVLVVIVDYTNKNSKTDELKYTYRVSSINGTETKYLESQVLSDNSVLLNNRHGIRVVFVIGGTIGQFDLISLLKNLVAALGLLKLSTLITDQLMLRVMPQKEMYLEYKYQKTADFSDIRDGMAPVDSSHPQLIHERNEKGPRPA
jgi:hypothetical protein